VRQQLNAVECGAACLAMILSYFGRDTSVAECRDTCTPGRDGLTARAISAAARKFGLLVKAYSAEPEALKSLPLPLIAHWEFNHFVVVERWSPQSVIIVDPAIGRQRLSAEAFAETGATPPGVANPEFYQVRSGEILLPKDDNWIEATKDLRKAFVEHPDLDWSMAEAQ